MENHNQVEHEELPMPNLLDLSSSFSAAEHSEPHDHTSTDPTSQITLTLTLWGEKRDLAVDSSWDLTDVAALISEAYGIPTEKQKYIITPKGGTFKHPLPRIPVPELQSKKIVLLGSAPSNIADINTAISRARTEIQRRRQAQSLANRPAVWSRVDSKKVAEEARYTFHAIKPLTYLPNPSRSQRFLERLASDPGIKASMRSHKFAVGLLTEMDPAMHTTHESRTLGLNRNRGEVIELRLRTDAYDGYRDYKTIRKTLCHELAHNVWGEHDRNFWELTKEIEREVERNDSLHGGRQVGMEEFYNPDDGGVSEGEFMDHGGWTGGSFVLGGGADKGGSSSSEANLSVRELRAKAAEERAARGRSGNGEGGTGRGHDSSAGQGSS